MASTAIAVECADCQKPLANFQRLRSPRRSKQRVPARCGPWSPAVAPLEPHQRTDAQILLELAERLGSGITGKPPLDAVLRGLGIKLTPARLANWALRLGPHGDHFLPWNPGLNAERALDKPDGWDLGPLRPGFRHRIFHPDKRIQLAPWRILRALDTLRDALESTRSDELLLIGRRQLRTNNSWMHNVAKLVSGREGCDLLVHPDDAARLEIQDGAHVVLENQVHSALVRARVSSAMRPGVVSLVLRQGRLFSGRRHRKARQEYPDTAGGSPPQSPSSSVAAPPRGSAQPHSRASGPA